MVAVKLKKKHQRKHMEREYLMCPVAKDERLIDKASVYKGKRR